MLYSKEIFYLTNEEARKLTDFIKSEFGLDNIMSIKAEPNEPVEITVFKC